MNGFTFKFDKPLVWTGKEKYGTEYTQMTAWTNEVADGCFRDMFESDNAFTVDHLLPNSREYITNENIEQKSKAIQRMFNPFRYVDGKWIKKGE